MPKKHDQILTNRVLFRLFWPYMKQAKWWYAGALFMATLSVMFSLVEPVIQGTITDRLIDIFNQSPLQNPQSLLAEMGFYLLAWFAATGCLVWVTTKHRQIIWNIGGTILGHALWDFYDHILHMDVSRFQEERSGELFKKFENLWDGLWEINQRFFIDFLPAVLHVIVIFLFGFWLSAKLALALIAVFPILLFLTVWHYRISSRQTTVESEAWERVNGYVGDTLLNIQSIKSFAAESRVTNQVKEYYDHALQLQNKQNTLWSYFDGTEKGVFVLARLTLFAAGGFLVAYGQASIGTLVLFLGLSSQLYGSLNEALSNIPALGRYLARMRRIGSLMTEIPRIKDNPNAKKLENVKGELEFQNVSYEYKTSRRVLNNISFKLPVGTTVALVGESGAGKSTIAQLVMRFADPTEGAILLDGHDLRDLTLKTVRASVGFVMQENVLFHDTIENNILFAKPNATKQEVEDAAKRAQAHEFISRLSKGYQTVVGERGVRLSGGQRQRIALARVLLANPPILVLDEATSALDSKTEHDLQIALKEVMKNRTTIVIAHRLSTVLSSDVIFVLHQGQIVDQGTHKDLLKRGGLYKEFWEIQAGGYV